MRFLATRIREGNIWSRLKQPLKSEVSKANGLGQLFKSNKEKDSVAFIGSFGVVVAGLVWFKDTKTLNRLVKQVLPEFPTNSL